MPGEPTPRPTMGRATNAQAGLIPTGIPRPQISGIYCIARRVGFRDYTYREMRA
jgi:hypothetical protein